MSERDEFLARRFPQLASRRIHAAQLQVSIDFQKQILYEHSWMEFLTLGAFVFARAVPLAAAVYL
jgi:hypothetical protein